MSDPSVVAVMLTANRPEMARQAIECFRAQTYGNKRLMIFDTGKDSAGYFLDYAGIRHEWASLSPASWTIGQLRNEAAKRSGNPDVLIHWDDDDYSHSNRIADQVALLQSSGADCVGYNEMLFWREPLFDNADWRDEPGEAWLFNSGNSLGTSLCYWRSAWEKNPFPATSYGEDTEFQKRLKCAAVSCFPPQRPRGFEVAIDPRMIARIHSGNTSAAYKPEAMRNAPNHWSRVPAWDNYCQGVFAK